MSRTIASSGLKLQSWKMFRGNSAWEFTKISWLRLEKATYTRNAESNSSINFSSVKKIYIGAWKHWCRNFKLTNT